MSVISSSDTIFFAISPVRPSEHMMIISSDSRTLENTSGTVDASMPRALVIACWNG